jgi:hypothetical protein
MKSRYSAAMKTKSSHFLPLLLLLCSALLHTSQLHAQPAPEYVAIDHVEFFVTDLDRSLAFYTTVFGADLWKNNQTPRRYLMLGNSYLTLEERDSAHVDHICFGINNFAIADVHMFLDMQGILASTIVTVSAPSSRRTTPGSNWLVPQHHRKPGRRAPALLFFSRWPSTKFFSP